MKKAWFLIIFLILALSYVGTIYAMDRVKLLPEPITGEIDIYNIGKDEHPAMYDASEYSVGVHEVTINNEGSRYNGINMVEYRPTGMDVFEDEANEWFSVCVSLFPGESQNAFVMLQSFVVAGPHYRIPYTYKVTLNANRQQIIVEEFKEATLLRRWTFPYNIRVYRVYEVSIGNSGFAVNERKTNNTIASTVSEVIHKRFDEIGFDIISPATPPNIKILAGTLGARAKFFYERLWTRVNF